MNSGVGSESTRAHRAEYREHSDGQHPRVRAELPRLELRSDPSDEAREVSRSVDAQTVDQSGVHAAPQQAARGADDGLHDRVVVDLVDVVLVDEHLLEAFSLWRLPL